MAAPAMAATISNNFRKNMVLSTSEFSGPSLTRFFGSTNSVSYAARCRPQCNMLDREASPMPSIDRQLLANQLKLRNKAPVLHFRWAS
jgi:hypothetical protein